MASSDTKLQQPTLSALSGPATNDAYRVKSIATRLTEAELGEIEAAATRAGKKVSEWLRDTALAHVRAPQEERTDPVLLAEIMGDEIPDAESIRRKHHRKGAGFCGRPSQDVCLC